MSESAGFSLVLGYASDMGSAEYVAYQLAQAAQAAGIDVAEVELNEVAPTDLPSCTHLIVVASTWGDGELPDNGALFWESLSAADAPALDGLRFAVAGLGDSSYPLYNNASRIIDERLAELGGVRLVPRTEYDCYLDGQAAGWISDVVKLLTAEITAAGGGEELTQSASAAAATGDPEPAPAGGTSWDRGHPYRAQVAVNRLLTGPGSDKEVRHFELDLGDSGIEYQAGDSLAVQPLNDPALVDAVLERLGESGDRIPEGHDQSLAQLLAAAELRSPSRELRILVADRTRDSEIREVLTGTDSDRLTAWLYGRDLVDLLDVAELSAEEVVATLRPLAPRDYSIASSPLTDPGRVHLTVAAVRYIRDGRDRAGTASTFLADRTTGAEVYLRPNNHFRLPAPDVPIIMVGPGTGIAPFRAFLAERQAVGATGSSWLFFGDRHRATDYLYREDLEEFTASGTLTRLDLAFSRDGVEKQYVWHRMLEHADELHGWLTDGAHLYVCGDATHMARDVDRTLHTVVAQGGGLDADGAHAFVNDLIRNHRYLRDVY